MSQKLKIESLKKHVKVSAGVVTLHVDEKLYSEFAISPNQIIDFVQNTINKNLKDDPLGDFSLLEGNLNSLWKKIESVGLSQPLNITVGVFGKHLRKISFAKSDSEEECLLLKIDLTPGEMKAINPVWLYHSILKKMKKSGYEWIPDKAHIESAWERLVHTKERLKEFPIWNRQKFTPHRKRKSYRIVSRPESGDIVVCLENIKKYSEQDMSESVMKDIESEIEKLAVDSKNTGAYKIFTKHIKTQIRAAYSGPQSLDLGLPYSFIGAIRVKFDFISSHIHPVLPLALLKGLQSGLKPRQLLGSTICEDMEDLKACHLQLRKMNLIVRLKDSKLDVVPPRIKLIGFVDGSANSDLCLESMEIAKDALRLKEKLRNYNTMMIGITKNDVPRYFEILEATKRKMQILLDGEMQSDEPEDSNLYHVNLQVFPLTRISPKHNHLLNVTNELYRNSRWCKLLIREMAGLPGSSNDPLWFAQHMEPAIPLDDIKASLAMLKKGGFLKVDKVSGSLLQTAKDIITDKPQYTQGSQFHIDVLDLALYSKEWESTSNCEFVAQSYYCSHATQKEISKLYHKFMVDVFQLAGKSVKPNLIYQISFQTFPLLASEEDYRVDSNKPSLESA